MFCSSNPFPTVNPDIWFRPGRSFEPGYDVVVVSGRRDPDAKANVAFASLGLATHETARTTVGFNGTQYDMLVYHVIKRSGPPLFSGTVQPAQPPSGARRVTGLYRVPTNSLTASADRAVTIAESQRADAGPLWIVVRATILGGPVDIAVLNRGGTDVLYQTTAMTSAKSTTVTLPIALLDKPGDIVLQRTQAPPAGIIRVESIDVFEAQAHT